MANKLSEREEIAVRSGHRLPSRTRLALAWIAVCVPAVLLYVLLIPRALNIPIWDDYDGTLDYLNRLVQLPSGASRWLFALTAQHTQYKLFFVNGLFWLQYNLFGTIDFRGAAIFSDLLLLPIAYLLWKFFLPRQQDLFTKLILFLPVSYLWFQLNYSETLDWGQAAYMTLTVLIVVLLGTLLLHRGTRAATAGALVCLFAAIFSSGSGFIFLIVGGILLLRRRRFAALAAWSVVSCACAALYAYHYTLMRLSPPLAVPFIQKNVLRILFAIAFLGGGAGYLVPALLLGLALCAFWIHMLRRGYLQRRPEMGYLVLYIVLVAVLVAAGRAGGGLGVALLSRYRLHSDLLLVFTWIAIADEYIPLDPVKALRSPLLRFALPLAAVFALIMDVHGARWIDKRDAWLRSGMVAWEHPSSSLQNVVLPEPGQPPQAADRNAWDRHATVVMEESMRLGVYHPPALPR